MEEKISIGDREYGTLAEAIDAVVPGQGDIIHVRGRSVKIEQGDRSVPWGKEDHIVPLYYGNKFKRLWRRLKYLLQRLLRKG